MKYVRVYTRQRLAILLAGICIIVFLTSRQAFLDGYQYPTILPPSIAHSDPRPPASKNTPSQPTGSPSPPHDSSPDSHPKSHPDPPSPPHATSTTAHAETTPTPLVANSTSSHASPNTPRCGAYPKDADVVIVVKTGGTETFQKIPTQLMTFLQCAPDDVLIFSDMELDIGGRHIYDCLDKVIDKTKKHADFDLYRIQKEYQREGGDVSSLDRARDAWTLDKYKNIHTAQKAHQLRPDKSWYFFIDADTYIFWPSFFAWLKRLNPNDKLYLGSVVNVGVPPFAHGGSGYLLSKAAMAELVGDDAEELAARYDKDAIGGCCGDQEIAKILFDKGINATNVRPMINGEHAKSIPFGPSQWCQPLITMHHMSPESVNDVWQYEGQRAHPNDILLSEDFFYTYAQEKIIASREDWDNVSNDNIYKKSEDNENFGGWWTFNKPYFSYKSCSKACEEDERCFQFSYTSGECGFGAAFKVGAKRIPKDGVKMKSGWHLDKIAKFTGEHKCKGPDWDSLA